MNNTEKKDTINQDITINPWTQMWINPRETIKHIVKTNPTNKVILLAILTHTFAFLDKASLKNTGDNMDTISIIFASIFIGGLIGYSTLNIYTSIIKWIGKYFGGVATFDEIRAAVTWGSVPYIMSSAVLYLLKLSLFGSEIFTSSTPRIDSSNLLGISYHTIGFYRNNIGNFLLHC